MVRDAPARPVLKSLKSSLKREPASSADLTPAQLVKKEQAENLTLSAGEETVRR